jgi:hypothetical protein
LVCRAWVVPAERKTTIGINEYRVAGSRVPPDACRVRYSALSRESKSRTKVRLSL